MKQSSTHAVSTGWAHCWKHVRTSLAVAHWAEQWAAVSGPTQSDRQASVAIGTSAWPPGQGSPR